MNSIPHTRIQRSKSSSLDDTQSTSNQSKNIYNGLLFGHKKEMGVLIHATK